jgi:hypothetical protein
MMARKPEDDAVRQLVQNPLVLAAGTLAGAIVLGGTLAYVHSSPERLRRFREGGERVARQSAEARRQLERERRLRRMREEYFTSGAGRDRLAERAFDIAPVGRPFPDAVCSRPGLNAYSYGNGFSTPSFDARFEYAYDGHDGIGRWALEMGSQAVSGAIARPDSCLTIYCPKESGLLDPTQREVIRRLLGTPSSRISEVKFVSANFRDIEEEIWRHRLAEMGEEDSS